MKHTQNSRSSFPFSSWGLKITSTTRWVTLAMNRNKRKTEAEAVKQQPIHHQPRGPKETSGMSIRNLLIYLFFSPCIYYATAPALKMRYIYIYISHIREMGIGASTFCVWIGEEGGIPLSIPGVSFIDAWWMGWCCYAIQWCWWWRSKGKLKRKLHLWRNEKEPTRAGEEGK